MKKIINFKMIMILEMQIENPIQADQIVHQDKIIKENYKIIHK